MKSKEKIISMLTSGDEELEYLAALLILNNPSIWNSCEFPHNIRQNRRLFFRDANSVIFWYTATEIAINNIMKIRMISNYINMETKEI